MAGQISGQLLFPHQTFDEAIEARHLTNQEVAWALGVSEKTIIRWRKGAVTPRAGARRRLFAWMADSESQRVAA